MPTLTAAELAQRLRTAREAAGLSQHALAQAAGVSHSGIVYELERGIERERNPVMLARLALALGQPWDYFGAAPPAAIPPGPGRQLYAARLAKGWTLDDLVAAAGVGRSTVHKLEHGQLAGSARTWADLARALEVEPATLIPPPGAPAREANR